MSWDISIHPALENGQPDLRDEAVLDSAEEVRARITKALPAVQWESNSWGLFEAEGASFEINLGDVSPVQSFMLHVRFEGDALPAIVQLCKANGWAAIDMSEGPIDLDAEDGDGDDSDE